MSNYKGVAEAQFNLGNMAEVGGVPSVPKDIGQAVFWYKKASSQDYTLAQRHLGLIYLYNSSFTDQKQNGIELLTKAALKNDVIAQSSLGFAYRRGIGTRKDIPKSLYWNNIAASKLNADALGDLGVTYSEGADGVGVNLVEAAKWMGLAVIAYKNAGKNELADRAAVNYQTITSRLSRTDELEARSQGLKFWADHQSSN